MTTPHPHELSGQQPGSGWRPVRDVLRALRGAKALPPDPGDSTQIPVAPPIAPERLIRTNLDDVINLAGHIAAIAANSETIATNSSVMAAEAARNLAREQQFLETQASEKLKEEAELRSEHTIKQELRKKLERQPWVDTSISDHMKREKKDRENATVEAVFEYTSAIARELRSKGIIPGRKLTLDQINRINAHRQELHLKPFNDIVNGNRPSSTNEQMTILSGRATAGIAYKFAEIKQGLVPQTIGGPYHGVQQKGLKQEWVKTGDTKDFFVVERTGVRDPDTTDPVAKRYEFRSGFGFDGDGRLYTFTDEEARRIDTVKEEAATLANFRDNGAIARTTFSLLTDATGLAKPAANDRGEGFMTVFERYAGGLNSMYEALTGESYSAGADTTSSAAEA